MTESSYEASLCVAGLVYLEVHVPVEVPPFEPGVEHFVDELSCGLGGAINSASVAHALGAEVILAHPDASAPVAAGAIEAGVTSLRLEQRRWPAGGLPAAISLVQSRRGERAFISAASFSSLSRCMTLPPVRWVHVPGLYEARALESQLRAARSAGSVVSVAGSWAPDVLDSLTAGNAPPWDLLVLNAKEAARATGSTPYLACKALARPDLDVVITAGSREIVARFGALEVMVMVREQQVVDSTGAGDAFCAGLAVARLAELPVAEALDFASRVASRCLTQRGGVAWEQERYAELAAELAAAPHGGRLARPGARR